MSGGHICCADMCEGPCDKVPGNPGYQAPVPSVLNAADISVEGVEAMCAALRLRASDGRAVPMLRALRTALTARAWQPIETVPKGKRVLVAYDYHLTQGIEIKECVIGHGFIWPSNAYTATHWMPLPEAP